MVCDLVGSIGGLLLRPLPFAEEEGESLLVSFVSRSEDGACDGWCDWSGACGVAVLPLLLPVSEGGLVMVEDSDSSWDAAAVMLIMLYGRHVGNEMKLLPYIEYC